MKHCPQCEFTFDDREQLCDFDGTELTVVPEMLPSFKSVSFAPAASGSFVRRLVKSRAGLPALALAGVVLSALLVGYYDSVSQGNIDMSQSQTRNNTASTFKSTQVDAVGQVETKADRPRIISTQRRIGADELPSSMVKRLLDGSRSRSFRSRRSPSSSKLVATKRKAKNANRPSQARNQARPDSRERVRQQHSTARMANRRLGGGTNESAHHRKDSKVIAILKKTGNILKRPFELIDR
jgi:hypothetical protein